MRWRAKKLLLPTECQSRHIYNQFTLRVPGEGARDRLRAALQKARIETEIYYPVPMHLQGALSGLGHKRGDFPVAERAAEEMLSLPMYPGLSTSMQDRVIEELIAPPRTMRQSSMRLFAVP